MAFFFCRNRGESSFLSRPGKGPGFRIPALFYCLFRSVHARERTEDPKSIQVVVEACGVERMPASADLQNVPKVTLPVGERTDRI